MKTNGHRDTNEGAMGRFASMGRTFDMSTREYVLVLIAALVMFFVVQFATIERQSMFIDEVDERQHASESVNEILYRPDSMPPVYSLLLKVWLGIADSDESSRWMSVGFAMMTLIFVWWTGEEIRDRRVGAIALLLLSVSPFFSYYAQLTRGYSLFCLIVSIELLLVVRAMRTQSLLSWTAFGFASAVGSYVHYYNCFPVATMYLASIMTMSQSSSSRIRWSYVLVSMVLFALLSLPSGIFVQSDFLYQKNIRDPRPISFATAGYMYASLISGFSIGPSQRALQTLSAMQAVREIAPWVPLFVVSVIPLSIVGLMRLARVRMGLMHGMLLTIPVLFVVGLSAAMGLNFNVRYLAWMIIPTLIVLAAGIASSWRLLIGKLSTIALFVLFGVANYNRIWNEEYQHEDLRSIALYLDVASHEERPNVFVTSEYVIPALRYYIKQPTELIELPVPGQGSAVVETEADAVTAADRVKQILLANGSMVKGSVDGASEGRLNEPAVWWVYCRPFHGDPNGFLLLEMKRRYGIEPVKKSAGAILYRGTMALKSE